MGLVVSSIRLLLQTDMEFDMAKREKPAFRTVSFNETETMDMITAFNNDTEDHLTETLMSLLSEGFSIKFASSEKYGYTVFVNLEEDNLTYIISHKSLEKSVFQFTFAYALGKFAATNIQDELEW